ncbi:hypothetical protein ACIBTW_04750 [Micromonospora parva]|uniref:hypothetical protein n=1 Tax=Micromonospora parva TaxID=1464048 RepID=UPI0037A037F4
MDRGRQVAERTTRTAPALGGDLGSKDGSLLCWDGATVFGLALAARARAAMSFSHDTRVFPSVAGESVLAAVRRFKDDGYFFGMGTDTEKAVRKHYDGRDRVVILTDEQAHWQLVRRRRGGARRRAGVHLEPRRLPGRAHAGRGERHTFGGLSDAAFAMIPLIEAGSHERWPF